MIRAPRPRHACRLAAAALLLGVPARGLTQGRGPFHQMDETEIAAALGDIHASTPSLSGRVAAVSERFLGTPYVPGPLGEGASGEFDRDPLADFKSVDCTTMVEQTLALALEPDLSRAIGILQRIRYKDGKISNRTRNHFPIADWIPNNVAAGYLADITRLVAGGKTGSASKRISKRSWYAAKKLEDLKGFDQEPPGDRIGRLERFRALGARSQDRRFAIEYLPIEELPGLAGAIPSGTVANLVREDRADVPVLVSHQVLIIDRGGSRFVRHAAAGRNVEDVPLLEYFYRYFNSRWKLLGLNLLEPRRPGKER